MISPERIFAYLKRVGLILGIVVVPTVLLGLLLAKWVGGGLAENPLGHALLAVASVLPVLLALVAVPLLASRFVAELYAISRFEGAFNFLSRLLFGSWQFGPYVLIKNGKISRGEDTVLHRVGGPGALVIYHDSAVVTERCGRLERVLGAGFPRLERFEKIWEIIDLRPQRWVFPVKGMTREGIPVICEADVHFKVDDRVPDERGELQPKPPTDKEPYPYTPEAVFRAATTRWFREPDSSAPEMDWAGRVMAGFTEGALRNILAEYRLDWLIAPSESEAEHPREVIRGRLEAELRKLAPQVGARILRVDLGEIRVEDDKIPRQWIEAWQAEWESRTQASRTEGEAELLRMDVARAQAQAGMVIALTQALQSVVTDETEVRPYLLATRFVEALRWMCYDPYTRAFMPPEAIHTLKRLQDVLGADRSLPNGQTGSVKPSAEGK
jgi:hypothetical protein